MQNWHLIVFQNVLRTFCIGDTKIEHQGEFRKRYPHASIGGVKECGTRALLAFSARHHSECVLLVKKFSFFFFFFVVVDENASFE